MAEIRFDFLGDTSDLQEATRSAAASIADFDKRATSAMRKVAKVTAGVTAGVAAAAGAAALLSKKVVDLAAEANRYAKEARKIGSTAEEIQRLEGAFSLLTDAQISAGRVIQDLGRNLADARDGVGEAQDSLAKLNLTAADLVELPIDRQVAMIADRFRELQDPATKSQVALDVFGRSGRELVPALNEGGEAIRAAIEQIEEAGIISNEAAADSERLTDAVELMGRTFASLKRDVLAPLIPDMVDLVRLIAGLAEEARKSDSVRQMAQWVLDVARGATVAAGEMAKLLGIIESTSAGPGGLFLDSEEIRAQVDEIERLQAAVDQAAAVAERHAQDGVWRAGDLEEWERAVTQMREAQQVLKELKATQAAADAPTPDLALPELALPSDTAASPVDTAAEEAEAIARVRVEAKAMEVAQILEHEAALWEALQENRQREIFLEEQAAAQRVQIREQATSATISDMGQMVGAISGLVDASLQHQIDAESAGSAERKRLMKEQFRVNKVAAVAQAAVNTALAASNAFASAGNPIVGAALAALATGVGLAQVAVIAAKPEPTFHAGTPRALAPDEGRAVVRKHEAVSNPQGADMLGRDAIAAANRGEAPMQQITVVNKMNNRTVDAQIYEARRRPESVFSDAIRSLQPTPVGAARVW